ncbi:MAG TPA: aminotransferase class I/II-fold pyridoxal phosphate-dependent enzyme [Kineosporiaceae bacterium]
MPRIAPDRGSVAHFARLRGTDLLGRSAPLREWVDQRVQHDLWPYNRAMHSAPTAVARLEDLRGAVTEGVNLASQDYLGLATAPRIVEAAVEAARAYGVHSAGSGVLSGGSPASRQLEAELGELVQAEHVLLFPTGWAAGFGAVVGLVRPYDYVILDEHAHACLHQGAAAATPNVRRHPHLDADALKAQLVAVRAKDADAGILVVAEGLYSMDADVPRLRAFLELAHEYGASLLVDQAHDLGATGPGGTGQLGAQGLLGQADLVMGAFSKTLASNGGFVATNSAEAKITMTCLGGSFTFSNALSPVQVAVVREALRVVRSAEGERLRASLHEVSVTLRAELAARGHPCSGIASAVNPVLVGSEAVARAVAGEVARRGVLANLAEFPAVAIGSARLRLQAMATHAPAQMRRAAGIVADTIDELREAHGSRRAG